MVQCNTSVDKEMFSWMNHVAGVCQIDNDSLHRPRSEFDVEVFSESDWAECNVTRKAQLSSWCFYVGM